MAQFLLMFDMVIDARLFVASVESELIGARSSIDLVLLGFAMARSELVLAWKCFHICICNEHQGNGAQVHRKCMHPVLALLSLTIQYLPRCAMPATQMDDLVAIELAMVRSKLVFSFSWMCFPHLHM